MVDVNIVINDDQLSSIQGVAAALQERGMVIEYVSETIGVINGSIPEGLRPSLLAVPGVAAIEESRGFQLPPPEADIQ